MPFPVSLISIRTNPPSGEIWTWGEADFGRLGEAEDLARVPWQEFRPSEDFDRIHAFGQVRQRRGHKSQEDL